MTTTSEAPPTWPQPDFPHHAYGVDMSWFGDEGEIAARGHVPHLRFLAACNHLARKDCGLANVFDDKTVTLEDALDCVAHLWVVPTDPACGDFDWAVTWRDVTEHTPGAIPITTLMP